MSKHTSEPWSAQTNFEGVFISGSDRSVVGKMMPDGPNKESDARRIVACVNACEGVDTESLEKGDLDNPVMKIVKEKSELKQQCDELLAALEEGRRAIGEHFAPNDCYATGPMTGDEFRDLVQCPACSFIAMYDEVITKEKGGTA